MPDLTATENREKTLSAPESPSKPVPSQYIQNATSDNTRRAYRQDIQHFERWGGKLPTDSATIIHYLHQHAEALSTRTLQRRITALRQFHLALGFPDPTNDIAIRKTLRGIQNTHGKPRQQATALRLHQLKQIIEHLLADDSLTSYRDRCLMTLGYFGALRASELLNAKVEDLSWSVEGFSLLIRRSKTDQIGEGQTCALPTLHNAMCPVKHATAWLEKAGLEHGHLFCRINRWQQLSTKPLSLTGLNKIIKGFAQTCQWSQPESYSSHSLRRGLATSASAAGASFKSIMRQGRWQHEGTVLQYIEEGQAFEDNPVRMLFSGPPTNTTTQEQDLNEPERTLNLSSPEEGLQSEGA